MSVQLTRSFVRVLTVAAVFTLAVPARAGTVAYWRFEDDPETTEVNEFLDDSSGNGHTLTPFDAFPEGKTIDDYMYTLPSVEGEMGYHVHKTVPQTGASNTTAFGGDGAVRLALADVQDDISLSTAFTIEAYLYANRNPQVPVSKYRIEGDQRSFSPSCPATAGNLICSMSDDGVTVRTVRSDILMANSTDYYVAITFDASDSDSGVTFYERDLATGVWTIESYAHTLASTGVFSESTATFFVGGRDTTNLTYDGLIDELRISNTVLTQDQLLASLPAGVLQGDLNSDGFVGGDDLDIVRSFWGQSVTPGDLLQGDPSNDGFVGGDDLDIVRANWGQGTPPAPGVVPEPSTLVLLMGGLFGGLFMLRRNGV